MTESRRGGKVRIRFMKNRFVGPRYDKGIHPDDGQRIASIGAGGAGSMS